MDIKQCILNVTCFCRLFFIVGLSGFSFMWQCHWSRTHIDKNLRCEKHVPHWKLLLTLNKNVKAKSHIVFVSLSPLLFAAVASSILHNDMVVVRVCVFHRDFETKSFAGVDADHIETTTEAQEVAWSVRWKSLLCCDEKHSTCRVDQQINMRSLIVYWTMGFGLCALRAFQPLPTTSTEHVDIAS